MADFPPFAQRDPDHNIDSRGVYDAMESGLPLGPGMAYREFLDSKGVSWRVWSTIPSAATRLGGGFDQGWLTFERTSPPNAARAFPLRRLVPIPPDGEEVSDNRLELLCRSAEEVPRGQVRARNHPNESPDSR